MADAPPITPETDQDVVVLKDAADAAFTLGVQARMAAYRNDPDADDLKAKSDDAHEAYTKARLTLLKTGTDSTADDVATMRRIKQEIDAAATVQTQIQGALSLIGFLGKFF